MSSIQQNKFYIQSLIIYALMTMIKKSLLEIYCWLNLSNWHRKTMHLRHKYNLAMNSFLLVKYFSTEEMIDSINSNLFGNIFWHFLWNIMVIFQHVVSIRHLLSSFPSTSILIIFLTLLFPIRIALIIFLHILNLVKPAEHFSQPVD